jgi:hypothetical protein
MVSAWPPFRALINQASPLRLEGPGREAFVSLGDLVRVGLVVTPELSNVPI